MDEFSFGGAWRAGWQLLAERFWLYAAILVGLGVILPLAIQFALLGHVAGMTSPFSGQGAAGGMNPLMSSARPGEPAMAPLIMLIGYVFQAASYFTVWRLALGRVHSGPAFGFGALGGVLMIVATIVVAVLVYAVTLALQAAPYAYVLLLPLMLLPVMVELAAFYTAGAAMLAAFMAIAVALTMLFGTMLGNAGLAATIFGGGSGMVAVMFIVMAFVLLWLASRLCCTGPLLAAWPSFNLPAAMRASFRLTYEDRWPILRYLFLVGTAGALAFALLLGGSAMLAARLLRTDAQLAQWLGFCMGALLAVPLALISAMIPVGIYRDLTRSDQSAEVFA